MHVLVTLTSTKSAEAKFIRSSPVRHHVFDYLCFLHAYAFIFLVIYVTCTNTLVQFVPSALLKNALDWASRAPNAWGDKAAAIVSVEGSGKCGQYHLRQIGVFLDLHFINKPEFFLNGVEPPSKFDNNGDLIDEAVRLKLKQLLLSLHAFATRLIKGKC